MTHRPATVALAQALADVLWGRADQFPSEADCALLDALRDWLAGETPAPDIEWATIERLRRELGEQPC